MRSNLENMLICDVALAVSGYNYYGYLSSSEDSKYIIIKEKEDETEYRYAFGTGSGYSTAWSGKSGLNYILPNLLSGRE